MNGWQTASRAVAAHGLVGARLPMPKSPLEPTAWEHLLTTTRGQRITGHLMRAIQDGAFPATPEQAGEVERAHRASMATALALEATLVRTARLLEETGIDYRVLKGTGVAHLDYPDPALRSFGDVDLLIPSSQFDGAVAALLAAGHQRKFPEPRPAFDRRYGKGSCLVSHGGEEIDRHRTLAMGPYGLQIVLDDLWRRSSTFELGGRRFSALGPEERFLHACFHAVLGDNPIRLASLRDVAQMHLARPLDVEVTLELSASWRADAVVARAVSISGDRLGLESDAPLVQWARGFTPSKRDRHFLTLYDDATANYAAKSFAAVRAIPGIRDKATFVFTLALPARRYLDQRQERVLRRWVRGFRQVMRSRHKR